MSATCWSVGVATDDKGERFVSVSLTTKNGYIVLALTHTEVEELRTMLVEASCAVERIKEADKPPE